MRRSPAMREPNQLGRGHQIDFGNKQLVKGQMYQRLNPREERRRDLGGIWDILSTARTQRSTGSYREQRDLQITTEHTRRHLRPPATMGENLDDISRYDEVEVLLIGRLLARAERSRADWVEKGILSVSKAGEPSHLANDRSSAYALHISPETRMGVCNRCLGNDVEVSTLRDEEVSLIEELAACRKPTPWLAGTLGNGTQLLARFAQQGDDQVLLGKRRTVTDDCFGAKCLASRHAYSPAS